MKCSVEGLFAEIAFAPPLVKEVQEGSITFILRICSEAFAAGLVMKDFMPEQHRVDGFLDPPQLPASQLFLREEWVEEVKQVCFRPLPPLLIIQQLSWHKSCKNIYVIIKSLH